MALYRYQVEGRTEKDYKEKADQSIEADIQVEPSIHYSVGEVHDIVGVGEVFEGGYKIKAIDFVMNANGFAVSLKTTKERGLLNSQNKPPSKSDGKGKATLNKKEDKIHTVKAGDTLSAIAKKFTGNASNWKKIEEANRSVLITRDKRNASNKGHWIYPGMDIKIPSNLLK